MICYSCGVNNKDTVFYCNVCGKIIRSETRQVKSIYEGFSSDTESIQLIEVYDNGNLKLVPKPHLNKRFMARMIDVILIGTFTSFVLGLIMSTLSPDVSNAINSYLGTPERTITLATLVTFIFVEAWMLNNWGASIGKYMFGLRVYNKSGFKLTYSEALKRSALVMVQGMALGVITLYLSSKRATETNTTSWDEETNSMVFKRVKQ